jgi:hypothetical protein
MTKTCLTLITCALILAVASVPGALCGPPFWFPYCPYYPFTEPMGQTTATLELEMFVPFNFSETIVAKGPTNVSLLDDPHPIGVDRYKIDTQITYMNLNGTSAHFGDFTIKESTTKPSLGAVEQLDPPDNSSALSYFGVYFEITAMGMTFHNDDPKNMSAIIHNIPPWGALYWSTPGESINLKDKDENVVGKVKGASHQIPPKPGVGGFTFFADGFRLLAPYVGLALTITASAAATVVCVKRVARREKR